MKSNQWTDWETSESNVRSANTNLWYHQDIFKATLEKASKTNLPLTDNEKRLIGLPEGKKRVVDKNNS